MAIAAIVIDQSRDLIIRVVAALGFITSFASTAYLYYSYMIPRIPFTLDIFAKSKSPLKRFGIQIWLVAFYPQLLLKAALPFVKAPFDLTNIEFGYLSLLASLFLVSSILIVFLVGSLSR
jgi:hypothetical protein